MFKHGCIHWYKSQGTHITLPVGSLLGGMEVTLIKISVDFMATMMVILASVFVHETSLTIKKV